MEEVGPLVCVRLMVHVQPLVGKSESGRCHGNNYAMLAFLMLFPKTLVVSNSQM